MDGSIGAEVPDVTIEVFGETVNLTGALSTLVEEPVPFDDVAKDLNKFVAGALGKWVPTVCRSMEAGECARVGGEWCEPDAYEGYGGSELGVGITYLVVAALAMLAGSWNPRLAAVSYTVAAVGPTAALVWLHGPVSGPYAPGSNADASWRIEVSREQPPGSAGRLSHGPGFIPKSTSFRRPPRNRRSCSLPRALLTRRQAAGAVAVLVAGLHMLLVGSEAVLGNESLVDVFKIR